VIWQKGDPHKVPAVCPLLSPVIQGQSAATAPLHFAILTISLTEPTSPTTMLFALVSVAGFYAHRRVVVPSSSRVGAVTMMPVTELQKEVRQLRAELVRKDAIIKGLLDTLEVTSITTDGDMPASSTPLQDLCQISKEACDAVTPMLRAFYDKISDQRHGGSSKLKADATYFTIADGIVQHMFINHLFAGNKSAAAAAPPASRHPCSPQPAPPLACAG
jgi:hypothetical protein